MEMNEEEPPPIERYDFINGATLLVDKPPGWTSFDVVNKIRHKLKKRLGVKKIKVGHAGTLDPMATGLLIICTGKATKQLGDYQGLDKVYTGTFRLGACTPSYDAETEIEETFPYEHITPAMLEATRLRFIGEQQQVPPMFSAIKVDGQPLYKKARQGEKIELPARRVYIYDFSFTHVDLPEVDFYLHCSKGTYVRSLAHDFGRYLDSGAYLTSLRRTRIGHFHIEDAWDLEELIDVLEVENHQSGVE